MQFTSLIRFQLPNGKHMYIVRALRPAVDLCQMFLGPSAPQVTACSSFFSTLPYPLAQRYDLKVPSADAGRGRAPPPFFVDPRRQGRKPKRDPKHRPQHPAAGEVWKDNQLRRLFVLGTASRSKAWRGPPLASSPARV
jgi:hypothetical protein